MYLPLQVRFTSFRDRPLQERQHKFIGALREGHVEIVSEEATLFSQAPFLTHVSAGFYCHRFQSGLVVQPAHHAHLRPAVQADGLREGSGQGEAKKNGKRKHFYAKLSLSMSSNSPEREWGKGLKVTFLRSTPLFHPSSLVNIDWLIAGIARGGEKKGYGE